MTRQIRRFWIAFALVALAMGAFTLSSACGGDDDDDDSTEGDDDDDDDDGLPSGTGLSDGCDGGDGAAGSFDLTITSGGVERRYLLDVPDSYDGSAMPLVLNLHGAGGSPDGHRTTTGFSELGADEGFINVYPAALENDSGRTRWDTSDCNSADHHFIADTLNEVFAAYCVDLSAVFVSGFSNGASFTNELVAGSTLFRAGAPVGGTVNFGENCGVTDAVSAIVIHGDADETTPPENGVETAELFAAASECGDPATNADGCEEYADCVDGERVVFCSVPGMQHEWPEPDDRGSTAQIWEFFSSLM
ncbi:MAG: hypothetical protein H6684_07965 [Deltaproteobacteria bacterium]|nr:hypothetical protein [Deltaproteobacteria bacterium]